MSAPHPYGWRPGSNKTCAGMKILVRAGAETVAQEITKFVLIWIAKTSADDMNRVKSAKCANYAQRAKRKRGEKLTRKTMVFKESDIEELSKILDEMKYAYGEDFGGGHYSKHGQINELVQPSWHANEEFYANHNDLSYDSEEFTDEEFDSEEIYETLTRVSLEELRNNPLLLGNYSEPTSTFDDQRPVDRFPSSSDKIQNENFIEQLKIKQNSTYFKKYLPFRERLPAYVDRKELLETIRNNRVTIIEGETGCGKSTQLPQLVLDDRIMQGLGTETYVVCTQPRRIGATSISSRVADERSEILGVSVGYQIRFASEMPRDQAGLLYCTTGMLLRRLEYDPQLIRVSHLFLDEVHEREIMTDFLMIVLKDLLMLRRDLRIILMSATIDTASFARYFRRFAPVVKKIDGRLFGVEKFYLENIFSMIDYQPNLENRPNRNRNDPNERNRLRAIEEFCIKNPQYAKIKRSLINWNDCEIDLCFVLAFTKHICIVERNKNENENNFSGAILIFLPGWEEIKRLDGLMKNDPMLGDSRIYDLVPLHSLLPIIDQKKVFAPAGPGRRKIILSTNISETSVTIDDVVYVLDIGKAKQNNFDHSLNVSSLDLEWISLMNVEQRRGRAGRCRNGYSFHFYPSFTEKTFERRIKPEILRTSVERLCLTVKLLKLSDSCVNFLRKSMDVPHLETILLALDTLYDMGAIDENENLTPLGVHLARLPVDPHVGKMLLYSVAFSCVDSITTVAACLDFKDPFVTPFNMEEIVDAKKVELCPYGSYSDHAMWINVVHLWTESTKNGLGRDFADRNFLSNVNLIQIQKMKRQFVEYLIKQRLLNVERNSNENSSNPSLVGAVVVAGLYPKVAKIVRTSNGNTSAVCSTKRIGRVMVHKKSVNKKSFEFPTTNLIYHICVKSSTIQMHDCAPATPLALILFGKNLTYSANKTASGIISVDNFVRFNIHPKNFRLVLRLNGHLKRVFERFCCSLSTSVERNSLDWRLLNVVVRLITEEKL